MKAEDRKDPGQGGHIVAQWGIFSFSGLAWRWRAGRGAMEPEGLERGTVHVLEDKSKSWKRLTIQIRHSTDRFYRWIVRARRPVFTSS